MLAHAIGPELATKLLILSGDVVATKKPDPAIYQLAVDRLGARKRKVVVVEDSTTAPRRRRRRVAHGDHREQYTAREDFSEAALVLRTSVTREQRR